MAVIGLFTASKVGGWEGRICTLSFNRRAKFTPNDNKHTELSPDFHIIALGCQIGVAWRRRPSNSGARAYLNVQLDDPALPAPISAALFPSDDEQTANLVWTPYRDGVDHGG